LGLGGLYGFTLVWGWVDSMVFLWFPFVFFVFPSFSLVSFGILWFSLVSKGKRKIKSKEKTNQSRKV